MARPKRIFNEDEIKLIEKYVLDGGKNNTIADALNIPINTLKRRFGKKIAHFRAIRKLKLAAYQTEQAKTSPQMAIFLGKNELDQVDKREIKSSGKGDPVWQPTEEEKAAITDISRSYKVRMASAGKTA